MLTLRLPDGSTRQVPGGTRPREVAEAISKRLAKDAVAAKVAFPRQEAFILFGDGAFGFNGGLNASAATLALNGTANTGGSLTQVIPNTNIVYTQLPVTAANALDVWNPAGATNRTSAAG